MPAARVVPAHLNAGYYVRPTVFARVTSDMTIAREEIFGPVLAILGYESEDDAIAIANDTPYGLAAYIQAISPRRAPCRASCAPASCGSTTPLGMVPRLSAATSNRATAANTASSACTNFTEIKGVVGYADNEAIS